MEEKEQQEQKQRARLAMKAINRSLRKLDEAGYFVFIQDNVLCAISRAYLMEKGDPPYAWEEIQAHGFSIGGQLIEVASAKEDDWEDGEEAEGLSGDCQFLGKPLSAEMSSGIHLIDRHGFLHLC